MSNLAIPFSGTQHIISCWNSIVSKLGKLEKNENIEMDVFISYKQSSAQGIAWNVYDTLTHADLKVFLDTEAKAELHDLPVCIYTTR